MTVAERLPGWVRRLSPRGEKTVRLVTACLLGACLGVAAVVRDSEPLGYAAVSLPLAGILLGPLVARILFPRR